MSDREHERVPFTVQVEFRTASSFLVAYSVNVSRGGLFLETEHDAPVGSPIALALGVAGQSTVPITGTVAWRRERGNADGPAGLGIEFQDVTVALGDTIDRLIGSYRGLQVLVLAADKAGRTSLVRLIRTIMATAEVVQAADAHVAGQLMTGEVDLAVVDVDFDAKGGFEILRAAKRVTPPVPTLVLAASEALRARALQEGASEVLDNPPPFDELQVRILRAIGRPSLVR